MEICNFINVAMSSFLESVGRLVGHIISKQRIAIDLDEVANIIYVYPFLPLLMRPRNFFGHTMYYRLFIFRYTNIAMSLTKVPVWTSVCSHVFNTIKKILVSAPIFVTPDWEKNHMYMDASNVAIGSILSKKKEKNHDHSNYFASC